MKNAIVTGATSGIGKATAIELSSNGYIVICIGRDEVRGKETVESIGKLGGKATFYQLDVTETDQIKHLFAELKQQSYKLDALVNAAGIEEEAKDPLDTSQWEKTFKTNLFGAVEFIRFGMPLMKEGVIVNISSLVGSQKVAFPTYSLAYEASKAALHKVTEAIAITHAPKIRAVTISPGYVETPIWDKFSEQIKKDSQKLVPIARFIQPEEIAKAVSAVITNSAFNGAEITVDGGLSLRKIY